MNISLENYLRGKLYEVERMGSYELATDTIKCWIDEYNEQLNHKHDVSNRRDLVCNYCLERVGTLPDDFGCQRCIDNYK